MRVAVIGCGNISRVHFKAIEDNPKLTLVAVADIIEERAKAKAEAYGVNYYLSLTELLRNEDVDCVHICTPHYIHTPLAIEAAEKGISVLIEKPCSMTFSQLDELRRVQEKTGVQVGVCFQNRYNDCVQYVRRLIGSGEAGPVKGVRAFVTWSRGESYYSDDWHGTLEKEGGGLLINQAIHTIDLMRIFGGRCKGVTCHISNDHLQGKIQVEDSAMALFELENAGNAVFYGTTAFAADAPVIIEVLFEDYSLRCEGERLFRIGKDGTVAEIGETVAREYAGKNYWGHGHSALINDFYDCLESGRRFEIDAFEGGEALKMVLGCYESAKENRKIVF